MTLTVGICDDRAEQVALRGDVPPGVGGKKVYSAWSAVVSARP